MLPIEPLGIPSPSRDVALWWCSLDPANADPMQLDRWLSEAERARMQRFGNEALRLRYLMGRASLRWVLARRLRIEPRAVRIVAGPRGRPRLDPPGDIDFNVSHTSDAALIGIARGIRIGVDIERSDRVLNAAGVARKFLTARERAVLSSDGEMQRLQVLRRWTCKEALAKATGDALSAPFSEIDVDIEPALRVVAGPHPYIAVDWALHAVEVPQGYLGTLALWRGRIDNGS
jgi:4'-phosphopantetheinyl transferase